MKLHSFTLGTVFLFFSTLCSSVIALFADDPLKEAAFILACLFWLLLPLAIFRELFYFRYRYLSKLFKSQI